MLHSRLCDVVIFFCFKSLPSLPFTFVSLFFLSFSRYCTRSCLTMMAGVGVAHKLLKGTWYQAMSLPNPRSLYFGLKPINCLRRDSFGCVHSKLQLSWGRKKFQPVRICIRTVMLNGVGSSTPVTSLRQVPILVNTIVTRLLFILNKKVKEACRLLSWSSGHWSSSSISPTWLWLRQRLQAQRAAVF